MAEVLTALQGTSVMFHNPNHTLEKAPSDRSDPMLSTKRSLHSLEQSKGEGAVTVLRGSPAIMPPTDGLTPTSEGLRPSLSRPYSLTPVVERLLKVSPSCMHLH